MSLLVKLGEPTDSTLCGTLPAFVQVHVTVPPAATVSTAGLADPLCPPLKKMLPAATGGCRTRWCVAGAPDERRQYAGGQETRDHEFPLHRGCEPANGASAPCC